MWQNVIVVLVVLGVLIYVVRHYIGVTRSRTSGCSGCSGCCGSQPLSTLEERSDDKPDE